jgi:outer membrane protein TolC
VPKSDVLKIEIQQQRETAMLAERHATVEQSIARLVELTGLATDAVATLDERFELPSPPAEFEADSTLDVRSLEYEIRAAESERAARRAARGPVVSLFGDAGAWTSLGQLADSSDPHVMGFEAGADVALPVWDGGVRGARVDEQEAVVAALRAETRAAVRRVRAGHDTATAQFAAAVARRDQLLATQTRAAEQQRLVVSRYAGGGSSGLEILDAHRSFLDIELEAEEARADVQRLQADLLLWRGE